MCIGKPVGIKQMYKRDNVVTIYCESNTNIRIDKEILIRTSIFRKFILINR